MTEQPDTGDEETERSAASRLADFLRRLVTSQADPAVTSDNDRN